jgi:hypothetical protein
MAAVVVGHGKSPRTAVFRAVVGVQRHRKQTVGTVVVVAAAAVTDRWLQRRENERADHRQRIDRG